MGPIKCALEMAAVNLIARSNSGLNSRKGGARDWMRSNKTSRTEISTSRRGSKKRTWPVSSASDINHFAVLIKTDDTNTCFFFFMSIFTKLS